MAFRLMRNAVIPLLLVLVVAGPSVVARFDSDSTSLEIGESVLEEINSPREDRVDFDRRLTTFTALQNFLENPITGRGFWSVAQVHLSDYDLELSAHGLVPGTLGELGILGLLIFAVAVWLIMRRAIQISRREGLCDPMTIHYVVGLSSLLMMGLFHQTIESPIFGLALALVAGFGYPSLPNASREKLAQSHRALARHAI